MIERLPPYSSCTVPQSKDVFCTSWDIHWRMYVTSSLLSNPGWKSSTTIRTKPVGEATNQERVEITQSYRITFTWNHYNNKLISFFKQKSETANRWFFWSAIICRKNSINSQTNENKTNRKTRAQNLQDSRWASEQEGERRLSDRRESLFNPDGTKSVL